MSTIAPLIPAPEVHEYSDRPRQVALVVMATIGVVVTLCLARTLFIPIALALFFNTLLRPLVRRLEGMKIPTPLGAAMVVGSLLSAFGLCAMMLWGPAEEWIAHAPERARVVSKRMESFVRPLQRVSAAADEIAQPTLPKDPNAVVVTPPRPRMLSRLFVPTAAVVGGAIEVVLLLYLLLASGALFLERLIIVLPGRADKKKAIHVATEVEAAISRYLGASTMINLAEAVTVGLVMWALGMEDAMLWGALTFVFEFVPYLGAAVLVTLLTLSAVTTFDSVGHALLVPGAYFVISMLQAYVVSPLLYGRRLRLNPVAVLMSVVFWGYIWGIPGAFLAVPILASGKILCDQTSALQPLGKFLEA